eukprot:CAMPEP_0204272176 /NCGR_PEP_ID=MMETSP0468-20130131/21941_2 /ASSEMBLY_ACC=CAM_ASM_000383 /TAXON_ID=2969 /ORGANISM="Oxyrrhis marina" /LENGTH=153 /DNA_ID=CAMNT_0051247993 /DNA_START=591 /DNA_END=1048 /DNA_ORIENTATION=-
MSATPHIVDDRTLSSRTRAPRTQLPTIATDMQMAELTEVPTACAAAMYKLWYAAARNPLIKPHSLKMLIVGALITVQARAPRPRPPAKYNWNGAPKPSPHRGLSAAKPGRANFPYCPADPAMTHARTAAQRPKLSAGISGGPASGGLPLIRPA